MAHLHAPCRSPILHNRWLICTLFIGIIAIYTNAQPAAANITISSISADFVDTSFDHTSGSFLLQSDNTGLEIKRSDNSSQTISNVSIDILLNLTSDTSDGSGLASGIFQGSFSIMDNDTSTSLLSGSIYTLNAQEVDLDFGSISIHQITSTGSFNQIQGNLQPEFGTIGDILALQINLDQNPDNLTDTSFQATSKLSLLPTTPPVPEPATFTLLLLAGSCLLCRKKKL